MPAAPLLDRVLVAIPAFGAAELTDAVLADLLAAPADLLPNARIVVVDNRGDYEPVASDDRLQVYRPGSNLRWIGSTNWALACSMATDTSTCIILNNDIRISPDFLYCLARSFADCSEVALAAPCYNDFWIHQRTHQVPSTAAEYDGPLAYRSVPFCDGTALAFSVSVAAEIGPLDQLAFPRHGYGADIDFALRARAAGRRCVIADSAYLSHIRRGTMDLHEEETSERNRAEILTGMDAKWGSGWRARAGLGPGAFPPHNTSSAQSWYL